MQVTDMAKNNNLTDFLQDIADTIRAKRGITGPISAQNFASEIASIESSGGGTSGAASKSDVNFYDYDGTLLHSYTKYAFLELPTLPDLPTKDGLTCQGWNYTIADAKEYVTSYGVLDIGAMYITDDGNTRLYIKIAAAGRMTVPLYFSQTADNGVTIDWGDGSATQTLSGTGNHNTTHTYTSIGDYVIILKVNSGTLGFGYSSSSYSVMGSTGNNGIVYSNMLQKIEIGNGVISIGNYAFSDCYSLTSVVIPNNVTNIGNFSFRACYSLTSIVIPNSIERIGGSAFQDCSSLTSVVIPESVTNTGTRTFQGCYSLASVVIPESLTSLGNYSFHTCYSLASVVIPNGIKSIGAYLFSNCYGMAYYEFTALKSLPTLANTNAFNNIPSDCKIVVPDSLYDTWIAATNWSTYANNIIKASEFNN